MKIKMIECVICKTYKSESEFIELRYGGFAICNACSRTPEAEEYKKKQRDLIKKANLKTQEEMDLEFHEQVGKYDRW